MRGTWVGLTGHVGQVSRTHGPNSHGCKGLMGKRDGRSGLGRAKIDHRGGGGDSTSDGEFGRRQKLGDACRVNF